jgi:hypothetical protein
MTKNSSEITLDSGRTVSLVEIRQSRTYEGLLEGIPTKRMNDRQIAHLMKEHASRSGATPVLITPIQTPIAHSGIYPFGTPASLPAITCVGRFSSGTPTRGGRGDYSTLTAVWFQDDFCFPVDSEIFLKLRALDWESLAESLEL